MRNHALWGIEQDTIYVIMINQTSGFALNNNKYTMWMLV